MNLPAAFATLVVLSLAAGAAAAPPQPPQGQQTPQRQQTPPTSQTSPAPQTPPAPQTSPRRTQPRATVSQVIVRDVSGTPLRGVRVLVSGTASLDVTTDANGVASLGVMTDGLYRFRFEQEGFVALDRDVTVKNGQPSEIYAALRIAPPPPAPPLPPPPAPEPPAPAPAVSAPVEPAIFVSIPAFFAKNYIGREPLKESVLGCLENSMTRLLQLRDSIAEHTHADVDEILYVVAGEGAVRAQAESSPVSAGSLSIIPRGLPHAIERRGKNPLMVLSTLAGAPCRVPALAQSAAVERK